MKRILAALVCVIMVCSTFVGCSARDPKDLGPIFDAYLGCEPYVLDPQIDHTDDDAIQIMSWLFEGLTNVNAKGKVEYALLDEYTYTKDSLKEEYKLTMKIKETSWSDSRGVTADDFIFSWKRILSPDFSSSAASLLFDIKNAIDAKHGEKSIDDVGIAAVDTRTIEVTFDHDIDVDHFLRKCASIALVPLREDVVGKSAESWSKRSTSIVSCGPYAVKTLDYEKAVMRLDRNAYYLLEKDDDVLEYVTPYQIHITFLKDDAQKLDSSNKAPESLAAQLEAYLANKIEMISDLPLADRASYKDKGTLTDNATTLSISLNCNSEKLSDAKVRQALSLALDRNQIASEIVYAKAASGLINNTCFDGSTNKTFREVGGSLISADKNESAAKALLSEAGVSSLKITLTYRQTEADAKVAEIIKAQWAAIGVTVELEPVLAKSYKEIDKSSEMEYSYYDDIITSRYNDGDYEAILIDYNMISVDPFAALAQFAKEFSGNACDMKNDFAIIGNRTGFNNEAYNTLIKNACDATDMAARASLLHDAEKMLLEQMPIIPVVFNQNFMMHSDAISGLKTKYDGCFDLKKVELDDYLESEYYSDFYKEEETN